MPSNYDESYQLFIDFINRQIVSIKSKLKNVEYYSKLRKAYNEIKSGNYMRFIDNYALLSEINENIKDNLDIIDYLVKNNIPSAPQMDDAISAILNDKELLTLLSNQESKEMLIGEEKKLSSIVDGTYDFDTFKNALLNSGLPDEDIIALLTYEAQRSTQVEKKQLPSLEEDEKEEIKDCKKVLDKVNKLIDKYYHLVENKPNNLIAMYRKTLEGTNMQEINIMFSEKDVILCMHILKLIDLKDEANTVLETKPVDLELIVLLNDELSSELENATTIAKEYERETTEGMPRESSVFFFLDDGKLEFNLDEFNAEEKKNIVALLQGLEQGLFDYERSKGTHTKVNQSIKKGINVFINRKRNTSVSFIRINSKDLKDSKTLILSISDFRSIFDITTSILKTKGKLIDEIISKIKSSDEEYVRESEEMKTSISDHLQGEEVPSR